jgi:alpha,alpha-trehalose phosphorylase
VYEVTALEQPARLILQSELVANEDVPELTGDPRVAARMAAPLESEEYHSGTTEALLVHHTRVSGLRLAAGMDHIVTGPEHTVVTTESMPDWARTTVACVLEPGETLRVVKFIGYGWSSQRSRPALRDQVQAAVAAARFANWDGLVTDQRAYLDEFWDAADVEIEGDAEIQQAVRFGLFHVLQAGARAEQRPIAAKGLTGPGYDGHTFWDTESSPAGAASTLPMAARDALMRHATLDLAGTGVPR